MTAFMSYTLGFPFASLLELRPNKIQRGGVFLEKLISSLAIWSVIYENFFFRVSVRQNYGPFWAPSEQAGVDMQFL